MATRLIDKKIISDYFTLSELTKSETANKLKIDNTPNRDVITNLQYGVTFVLEPLRRLIAMPVVITSGYRCPKLNKAVGGVPNSWHTQGNAADIRVKSTEHAKLLFDTLKRISAVDTVLFEHSKTSCWLHVQWNMRTTPRHHFNFNYKA